MAHPNKYSGDCIGGKSIRFRAAHKILSSAICLADSNHSQAFYAATAKVTLLVVIRFLGKREGKADFHRWLLLDFGQNSRKC
jgi:hypothetical protein